MNEQAKDTMKRAAFAGARALHAVRAAHGPAKLASRIPGIGPAVGLVVLVGAGVAAAVDGLTKYDG
jgi:hypothetical protein